MATWRATAARRHLDETVRPEGAFASWLLSDQGQAYLNDAERGVVNEAAIKNAVAIMKPFGMNKTLGEDMRRAVMSALELMMDEKYLPFRQHLLHHAVWDAVGKSATTHTDVMNSMIRASALRDGTSASGETNPTAKVNNKTSNTSTTDGAAPAAGRADARAVRQPGGGSFRKRKKSYAKGQHVRLESQK